MKSYYNKKNKSINAGKIKANSQNLGHTFKDFLQLVPKIFFSYNIYWIPAMFLRCPKTRLQRIYTLLKGIKRKQIFNIISDWDKCFEENKIG